MEYIKQYSNHKVLLDDALPGIEAKGTMVIGKLKKHLLVAESKVKTIKKGRKIYVPIGEVERYFGTGIQ